MIIEDVNHVPFYIHEEALILISLAGMQGPDTPEELSQKERVDKTVFVMNFFLTMGITQQISLSKTQYDNLWKRLRVEHE